MRWLAVPHTSGGQPRPSNPATGRPRTQCSTTGGRFRCLARVYSRGGGALVRLARVPDRRPVQTRVENGVLLVTPTSQGTTLRLGPAEDGSTHPLRPVDVARRKVLDNFHC